MENNTSHEVGPEKTKTPRLRADGEPDKRSVTSATNGAKGGRPVDKIEPDQLIEAAQRIIAGTSEERIRCDFSLSHSQAKFLMATAGLTPEEFRDRLAQRMENALSLALARIIESINEFELRDLSVTFGILNDHLLKMRGYATPTTVNQTNIQINGVDRAGAMAILNGKGNIGHNDRFPAVLQSETHARDLSPMTVEVETAPTSEPTTS